MFFTFSIGFQSLMIDPGFNDRLISIFLLYFVTHPSYLKQQERQFFHSDHFSVTQIEVTIYFWLIWGTSEQQKWQTIYHNRKLGFWWWDSNLPKILNSVIRTFALWIFLVLWLYFIVYHSFVTIQLHYKYIFP